MSEGGGGRSLMETPTWALATVCFVFIFIGLAIENLIHRTCHLLKKHKKVAMYEATEKLKSVLMQLGFMSLILTVTQRSMLTICIHDKAANYMLPCRHNLPMTTKHLWISFGQQEHQNVSLPLRRELATADTDPIDSCSSKGMTSLISQQGVNQLNIFIFVIAAMQIVYSVATMGLGRAKMKKWKAWEKETQTVEYLTENDPERFRLTRQTTFWRRHLGTWATTPVQLWIKCFFRQFFNSVVKTDYFTLRHGFIETHLSTSSSSFNFRKYIQRSLEDDFKAIVGISPIMWLMVVVFLLLDVHGWNVYLWVSFLPLIIVLIVGTKLEVIVAGMAMNLTNQRTVTKGVPLVQPDDGLFWFKRPQLVLTLLHVTLFMNAFEVSFFVWVTWQFGLKSCYHENVEAIAVRMVLAITVQLICGYITLPLYALVTQMGSQYKNAILEQHTVHAIKSWHANVKEKRKNIEIEEEKTMTSPADHIGSSHNRTPTLSEFASRGEITEEERR